MWSIVDTNKNVLHTRIFNDTHNTGHRSFLSSRPSASHSWVFLAIYRFRDHWTDGVENLFTVPRICDAVEPL